MFVLDTNVVSEAMRPTPIPSVMSWLNDQDSLDLFLSAVTLGEVGFGLRSMPQGVRRSQKEAKFEQVIKLGFAGRILSFDEDAANAYGEIMSRRKELGRPLEFADGQIAAIARVHGFAVVTRNVRDFEECGVKLVNPFPPEAE